jgi:hypothetical protein
MALNYLTPDALLKNIYGRKLRAAIPQKQDCGSLFFNLPPTGHRTPRTAHLFAPGSRQPKTCVGQNPATFTYRVRIECKGLSIKE